MRQTTTTILALCAGILSAPAGYAQTATAAAGGYEAAPMSGGGDFIARWQARATAAQAAQPGWMTPLVTVTPRLEQEVRADAYYETLGNNNQVLSLGNGKGLELIPTSTSEVILNAPTYAWRWGKSRATGFGDYPFMLVKERLASSPESDGNYIVTAFLGVQAPTGIPKYTNNTWVVTPTLAAGKGWGDFDIQATSGVGIPMAYEGEVGTSLQTNVTLQYHANEIFWPEVEMNWTYWADGVRGGRNQIFITPGIIFGRFVIQDRVKLIFGVGYQIAVSPTLNKAPLTPLYNNAALVTARITF